MLSRSRGRASICLLMAAEDSLRSWCSRANSQSNGIIIMARHCHNSNARAIPAIIAYLIWRQQLYFNSCSYKYLHFGLCLQQVMETRILEWNFNLGDPAYLVHPNFKFWSVTIAGKVLTFRVGKVKDDEEEKVEQVAKTYSNPSIARSTAIQKIEEKLTKGYVPKNAKKAQAIADEGQEKREGIKDELKNKKKSKIFSGEYYEKGTDAVRLEVNEDRVKITKIDKGVEKYEIRSFATYDQAVDFCLQEESWMLSQGFKANNSKFIYSFVEDKPEPSHKNTIRTKTEKKPSSPSGSNYLSITKMTDDAISHRSRNNSTAKSDRSYAADDADEDNSYGPELLGKAASGPISVLLAETWDNQIDPSGYIMSEKLDGVRCFWTGTAMYSRNGNRFFFPKFFTKGWPRSQMDGELFIDRGKFSETLSAVRKNVPVNEQWEKVRFLVFDCPGMKAPFSQRLKAMEKVIKEVDSPYLKCHAHRVCQGYDDLFKQLDLVNKIEGEGLMLRDPKSLYQNRRSKSLLKVKTFYDDEAEVIGYKPGTGRCHGMVGALRCRNTHGVEFEVGSGLTDHERRHPPKVGSKITYKYQEFNKDSGKPRFPTYMRPYDKI